MYGEKWIQKGITVEPPRNDSGANFPSRDLDSGPKARLTVQKSDSDPKVRVTAGQTPRIRTESPRKGPRMGLGASAGTPPAKPSWIHLMYVISSGWSVGLAAQCEIPPHIAQDPFEIVSQGIAAICLVFIVYRARIAEIPLSEGGGVSHLHFACSPRG